MRTAFEMICLFFFLVVFFFVLFFFFFFVAFFFFFFFLLLLFLFFAVFNFIIFSFLGTSQTRLIDIQTPFTYRSAIYWLNSYMYIRACYTAKARRCEYANRCRCLRVPALVGWSGPALKHSGTCTWSHSGV